MTQPAAPFDLAQLDAYRPATLDPAVWSANLAALSTQQPKLAEELRRAPLPDTWRPALALDDFVTFRVEKPGEPPAWLGDTAAPLTRARTLLGQFDPAGKNPALPCCGAGAELDFLLPRLPRHVAIFVFETDISVLTAVLRTHDLSAPIAQGRCILLPPGEEAPCLVELMERHPGLLPPGEVLLPNLVSAARIQELRLIGETVSRETAQRRSKLLLEITSSTRAALASPAVEPRLAILSLSPHPPTHAVAEILEREARRLGWPVLYRAAADPRSVHALGHCQALAEFEPNLTICVNHPPSRLPMTLPGTTCVWLLDEASATAELSDAAALYLAASPRVAAALRQAGVKGDGALEWYWACESGSDAQPVAEPDPTIILVADLPDPRPESCGVEHSTHKKLWEKLRTTVARVWETPRILEPERLLAQSERESQVKLSDPALRESLVRLIDRVMIPAVALEHIARALASEPAGVLTLGRGWDRVAERNFKPLAADLSELPDRGDGLQPRVCVFAGRRDPLSPTLLHAAARRWPLLLHDLGGRSLGPALGDVLRPGQHFEPFADLTGLRRGLKSARDAPQSGQRRVEKARRHVIENHSYRRRLQFLAALVQDASSRGNP